MSKKKAGIRTKGQMPIHSWAVLVARPANSAMANSDMQDGPGMPDSNDNSYAEL